MMLLGAAAGMLSEARFGLIVVDSATALFRSEFLGRCVPTSSKSFVAWRCPASDRHWLIAHILP
jgi:hypothetical protein